MTEYLETQIEQGDITKEFLSLSQLEFDKFLLSRIKENELIIKINIDNIEPGKWSNVFIRLKAFLQDGPGEDRQLRRVIVTGDVEQKEELKKDERCLNALNSGIEWENK